MGEKSCLKEKRVERSLDGHDSCIVYSSKTGNTQKVALALAKATSLPLFSVNESPSIDEYSTLILGFWVRRAMPDEDMLRFLESVNHKNIFFFCTHAAWPDSAHIQNCIANVRSLLCDRHNTVLGYFTCQGAVHGSSHKHPLTPERRMLLAEAARHPNKEDYDNVIHACVCSLQRARVCYTPGGKDFPLSPCPPSPCFQHPAHSMINAEV